MTPGGLRKDELERVLDATPSDELAPGTRVGRYLVRRLIGVGGMGNVYEVAPEQGGPALAMKILDQRFVARKELLNRFLSEAKTVQQISHPNIIRVIEHLHDEARSLAAVVMELLDGEDLRERLDRDGALEPPIAFAIGRAVASALAAAHDAGIIHRDLKPDNIFLLVGEPWVKVLDFGIAKLLERPAGSSSHGVEETAPGSFLGTPRYMSPEQSCGRPLDARSDIYSFGVILYEMLTGAVPFSGYSFGELLIKHSLSEPTPPSQRDELRYPIGPQVDRLVLDCLAKNPEDRPSSMAEVLSRLDALS